MGSFPSWPARAARRGSCLEKVFVPSNDIVLMRVARIVGAWTLRGHR